MMLMIGGFDPFLPWNGYTVAKKYVGNLARVGNWFSIGGGALLFVPISQEMALAIGCFLMAIALYLGREYRQYVDELLARTSLFKLLVLLAPSWRFFLITTILLGVGIGLSEWETFGHLKNVVVGAVATSAILDILKAKIGGVER